MDTRKYWLSTMLKIAEPVIKGFAERTIQTDMPLIDKILEDGTIAKDDSRKRYALLEGLSQVLKGIGPWLELEGLEGEEKELQAKYRKLTHEAIDAATDPASPSRCLWWDSSKGNEPDQPIVNAAHVAYSMIEAPNQLYYSLPERVRSNLIDCLRETSNIRPFAFNNWVLFGAMLDTALYKFTGKCDGFRIECALARMDDWFLGDGVYGDGVHYAWDYYNSFVINPYMVTVARETEQLIKGAFGERIRKDSKARLIRYAEKLMYQISPDGSYPPVGRSIIARMNVFHAVAYAAHKGYKLTQITAAQMRRGLTQVIAKCMEAENTFDENGWLKVGLCGFQPRLRDFYNSTGSLYSCLIVFFPLGLSPKDEFWAAKEEKTPWEKLWGGEDIYR